MEAGVLEHAERSANAKDATNGKRYLTRRRVERAGRPSKPRQEAHKEEFFPVGEVR